MAAGWRLGIFGLICFGFFSCKEQTTYLPHKAGDLFRMDIASYLKETDELNANALFQFKNEYKHVYLIVRADTWEDLAPTSSSQNYTMEDYYVWTFQQVLPGRTVPPPDSLLIGETYALTDRIESSFSGQQLAYYITLIPGESRLYQILAWLPLEAEGDYGPDVKHMIQSFQFL